MPSMEENEFRCLFIQEPAMPERMLPQFCRAVLDDLSRDAPEWIYPTLGLCSTARKWRHITGIDVEGELLSAFRSDGLDVDYPFNKSAADYQSDYYPYRNPARMEFLRRHANG